MHLFLVGVSVAIAFWTFNNALTLPKFPAGSPWDIDISESTDVNPDSSSITQWLADAGGWGNGNNFQIDVSLRIVEVGCDAPRVPFQPNDGYYYGDCDSDVSSIPLPADGSGSLEGWQVYGWDASCDGDCHLIVHDTYSGLLYESWDTTVTVENDKVTDITATCLVVWNTSHLYPADGRGEGCTSADAAGFPIAPLLFTADEIAADEIAHAIRFILPNNRMRKGYYIHPASHYGGPQSTDQYAVVYGSRLRLKADYDISGYNAAAQTILKALKKYGMFLSDGGNIPITGLSDSYSGYSGLTYDSVSLDTHDLFGLLCTDFEVMNGFGDDSLKGFYDGWPDCVRNDIAIDTTPPSDCGATNQPTTEAPATTQLPATTLSTQQPATTQSTPANTHESSAIISKATVCTLLGAVLCALF